MPSTTGMMEDALETFSVLQEDQNPQYASDQRGRDAARCYRQVKRKDVVELRSKQCQRSGTKKPKSSSSPPRTCTAKKNAAKCDALTATRNWIATGFAGGGWWIK
ncbi:MAG TPA: hypothetical protein VK699_09935 [Terriglobales bacterium]|jgi:hypothetical protein|nr:hypothetical protein [Terriglobales bacterium]